MELAAGLLEAAVRIALPLVLIVVGEIVAERSGVLNIGLEGMVLAGAFGGFAGAWATGSPWGGLALGVAAGAALAALFARLVVRWALDPIVSGVALNVLALGATGVLFRALTENAGGTVFVATFPPIAVPGLAELPVVGPAFFRLHALGYGTIALAAGAALFLSRTSPGLVLRAAGESPDAVETAGVDVARVRTLAVLFCGVTAGAAGAYLSCGYSDTFVENMSAGRGFVALAIVVFARWSPLGGAAGALLFGLATSLQVRLQGIPVLGAEIPYQFFQMLPYALTLLVLAGTSRPGAGAPAALARPWRRGR
jgi:simple sugar transport system permease protein